MVVTLTKIVRALWTFVARTALITILEIVAVTLTAIALWHFGSWAGLLWLGCAAFVKAFELDLRKGKQPPR